MVLQNGLLWVPQTFPRVARVSQSVFVLVVMCGSQSRLLAVMCVWQFDVFTKFSRKSPFYARLRKALLRQPGLGIYGAGVVIRSSRVQDLYPATRGICFSIAPSSNLGTRLLRLFEISVCFLCFCSMPVN